MATTTGRAAMSRHRARLATAFCGCALAVAASGMRPLPRTHAVLRVLFIGNSLTYTNDLPGTLALLASAAHDTMFVRAVALPDFALIDHADGGSNAVDVIRGDAWNFVVLQQGPSAQQLGRDTLILATRKLEPFIHAAGARSAQFMAWPASDRRTAFDSVATSSRMAAQAVGGLLIPVGLAWTAAWALDPRLPLYGADGYHPSEMGTYLAAIVIYESLTGHDAGTLPGRALVAGHQLEIPEATVRLLQRAAHQAVLQSRDS